MSRKQLILGILSILLASLPKSTFAEVEINGVKIMDDGRIIFKDASEQATATKQGPTGIQGPKGDPGTPGSQVTKDAMCQVYADSNMPPPPYCDKKIIFISSQKFNGNLGGLAGADLKCQTAASAAGLSGTFKAWLSDSNSSAKDRLTHSPAPYVRTDGVVVATNWIDLTDGWLKDPIICDEHRNCVANQYAWTGTDEYGAFFLNEYSTDCYRFAECQNWTSATFELCDHGGSNGIMPAGEGRVGFTTIASDWTNNIYVKACWRTNSLYCIEQ